MFDKQCYIMKKEEIIATEKLHGKLFALETETEQANVVSHCNHRDCTLKWHERLGHRENDAIKQLETKNLTRGMHIRQCSVEGKCVCCLKVKGTRPSFKKQHLLLLLVAKSCPTHRDPMDNDPPGLSVLYHSPEPI